MLIRYTSVKWKHHPPSWRIRRVLYFKSGRGALPMFSRASRYASWGARALFLSPDGFVRFDRSLRCKLVGPTMLMTGRLK